MPSINKEVLDQKEVLEWCIKDYFGYKPRALGTPENGNVITTSHMTIGVMSGYNVKNPTNDQVMEMAKSAKKEVELFILNDKAKDLFRKGYQIPDIDLKPAMTEYLPEWGCPEGGEKCVQADIGPVAKGYSTLFAMGMQLILDQSTVTVNFGDGENIYITKDENKIPQIEIFSSMQYDIPLIGADPKAAGEKIQNALIQYGKTHQDNQIYATGAVVVEHDGSLHYVGSRNALFCQDEDAFKKALSDMLDISGIVNY